VDTGSTVFIDNIPDCVQAGEVSTMEEHCLLLQGRLASQPTGWRTRLGGGPAQNNKT
jgi:hypothetical protein